MVVRITMEYEIHSHAALEVFWSASDKAIINKQTKEISMANSVTGLKIGGQPQILNDVNTVADVATRLGLDSTGNYAVKVNNQSSSMDASLSDGDFVSFGEKIKGGQA